MKRIPFVDERATLLIIIIFFLIARQAVELYSTT